MRLRVRAEITSHFGIPIALLTFGLAMVHCAKSPPPAPEPVGVENADLQLAIGVLPEAFSVLLASGPTIELEATSAAGTGKAVITAGAEERFGINLVEAVKQRKALFEGAIGGEYFGNRELGTPNGTAFTARGAYDSESGRVEETWVYTIHPIGNRLLTISYTYPPGESQERVAHILELLGEIEGFAPADL